MFLEFINDPQTKPYFSLPCYYPRNCLIHMENDRCDSIGLILKGSVKLSHFSLSGEASVLANLFAGDFFGDFLVHSKHPYFPGYLFTREETSVAYIALNALDELLVNSQKFRKLYIQNLSNKALALNHHNKLLSLPSLEEKILYYLEIHPVIDFSKHITFTNKSAMAQYLNVARPSLSRKLAELKNRNLLDYTAHRIWLK